MVAFFAPEPFDRVGKFFAKRVGIKPGKLAARDNLRRCKLEKPVYPASVMAVSLAAGDDKALKQAESEAIPEFMRFNIVESEVRDVV